MEKSQLTENRSARAKVKYLRIAPRKVRGVIDTIRHKHPQTALHILASVNKKAARLTEKLVKTVMANAKVLGMDESRLTISDIRADGGPVMKRFMERSMGRGDRILKRMTHLSVVVTEGGKSLNAETVAAEQVETKESPKAAKTGKTTKRTKKAAAAAAKA